VSAGCGDDTRIVVGLLCLAFSSADVIAVHELEGGRVRLIVRRGAPLLDAIPWECVAGEIPQGRKPFALSSRPLTIRSLPFSRFRELEARYLGGPPVAAGLRDDPARHTKG
jgi:hypothetical protein